MRRWPIVATLVLGCGWWTQLVKGEPPPERTVSIPFAEPGRVDRVTLRGAWLRAAELASADYFGGLKTPENPTPLETCLLRRESYDVEVWEQQELADAGTVDQDAGQPDAGAILDAVSPRLLFVTISLHANACDLGESPPTDIGGNFAIDTMTWKIVGWRP